MVIEFVTDIKDSSIKIPEEYKNFNEKHVKVIVSDLEEKTDIKLPKGFYKPIKISSYSDILSKDALHER